MKILDTEFIQGFIRMANDGWDQGGMREKDFKVSLPEGFLYEK